MVPIPVVPRPTGTDTSEVDEAAAVGHPATVVVAAAVVAVAMPMIVTAEVAGAAPALVAGRHVPAVGADRAIVTVWSAARATRSGIGSMNVSVARRVCPILRRII